MSLAIASVAGLTFASAPADATSPPPSWTNERIIECDGIGTLDTYLSPAGFGTPFTIVGSDAVIIPKHVEVTVDGSTFVTVDVPGFDPAGPHAVACHYTDPRGLFIRFEGLMTSAPN
jgi:hypothetical protein